MRAVSFALLLAACNPVEEVIPQQSAAELAEAYCKAHPTLPCCNAYSGCFCE